jgi:hypothetical protein
VITFALLPVQQSILILPAPPLLPGAAGPAAPGRRLLLPPPWRSRTGHGAAYQRLRLVPCALRWQRAPTTMAPLFTGCNYEHRLIVLDKPGGESANKDQLIDCYSPTSLEGAHPLLLPSNHPPFLRNCVFSPLFFFPSRRCCIYYLLVSSAPSMLVVS